MSVLLAIVAALPFSTSPRKKSRTCRLKSSRRSIIDQWPQWENTDRSALSSSSSSLSEVSSGMTWSSRPCTISVRCGRPRISSSATVIDSTQRWRGAGNIEENDSWKPGWVAPSKRAWARSPLVSDLS